jgi:hypothetical protein
LEAATGLDIDRDGKADNAVQVPGYDPCVSEVEIWITTIEVVEGHNSGKTCIRWMMMSFICSYRNKRGAELHISLEEGTYHTRLFRGPSASDMKK